MRNVLKYVLIIILTIVIFVVGFFFVDASIERIILNNKIEDFIEKGIYNEALSNEYVKYYKVEIEGEESGAVWYNGELLPGNLCDILISPETKAFDSVISSIVSYNVGGHAAIVTKDYRDAEINLTSEDSIEADYYNESNSPCKKSFRSYWNDRTFFDTVIGLRANLNEEEQNEIMSVVSGHIGDPYDLTFGLNNINKTYCSDLIKKVYKNVGIDLNRDGYYTTVLDIGVSKDLYITYYHFYKDNMKYVYYV